MPHSLLILRETFDAAPTVEDRTLTIRLATVGRIYTIGRDKGKALRERIAPGALKGPLARPAGVLRFRHQGERPGEEDSLAGIHGTMTRMWMDGHEVLSTWEVFPGPEGDKILRVAPAMRGASISAVVSESRVRRDTAGEYTDVTRISQINGASLTPTPAYDDAEVLALRERRRRVTQDGERRAQAAARRLLGSVPTARP